MSNVIGTIQRNVLEPGAAVNAEHTALNEAGVPTVFVSDTAPVVNESCDADTLATMAEVLLGYLKSLK